MFAGREYLYIEISDDVVFHELVDTVFSSNTHIPDPVHGGIGEEKTVIITPNNKRFFGLSYKGDLRGWNAKLTAYCKATGFQWASIDEDKLITSDGSTFPLEDCVVNFL